MEGDVPAPPVLPTTMLRLQLSGNKFTGGVCGRVGWQLAGGGWQQDGGILAVAGSVGGEVLLPFQATYVF